MAEVFSEFTSVSEPAVRGMCWLSNFGYRHKFDADATTTRDRSYSGHSGSSHLVQVVSWVKMVVTTSRAHVHVAAAFVVHTLIYLPPTHPCYEVFLGAWASAVGSLCFELGCESAFATTRPYESQRWALSLHPGSSPGGPLTPIVASGSLGKVLVINNLPLTWNQLIICACGITFRYLGSEPSQFFLSHSIPLSVQAYLTRRHWQVTF